MDEERLIWSMLLADEVIGPATLRKIKIGLQVMRFSLQEFWNNPDRAARAIGLNQKRLAAIKSRRLQMSLDNWANYLNEKEIKVALLDDPNFPELWRFIPDYPAVLFYRGNLDCLNKPTLSIVGTRKITNYGRAVIRKMFDYSMKNVTVVSGMMTGVDQVAHEEALRIGAQTAAILGYGLELIWPANLKELKERILQGDGVLISEYPPWARPQAFQFPMRNRLVAGASAATLVIEAQQKSGSLITANLALDYGRDVLTIPGSIFAEFSEGCNQLLKNGAQGVTKVEEIISVLKSNSLYAQKFKQEWEETDNLPEILQILRTEALTIEEICAKLNYELPTAIQEISNWELEEKVKLNVDGTWELCPKT